MSLPKRFPIGCCHSQLSRTGHNKHCDAIPKEPFEFRVSRVPLGTKGRLNDLLQLKKKKNFLPVSQEQIGSYSCLGSLVDLL